MFLCGLIFISIPQTKDWALNYSGLNLGLAFALLIYNSIPIKKTEAYFLMFSFAVGFVCEVIGVNTALLFGHYEYSGLLGFSVFGVPLVIGINWAGLSYVSKIISQHRLKTSIISSVILRSVIEASVSCLLLLGVDVLLEPVAIHLNFWRWTEVNGGIPTYNYVCWGIISFCLGLIPINTSKNKFDMVYLFALIIFLAGILVLQSLGFA
jgi:putative membrane protein